METATFGAGGFWGLVLFFREVLGVAEIVRASHDPAKVNFSRLLNVFLANHDPTRLNRQGLNYGSQHHQRYFEKNGLPSCHVNLPES